jgi:HlyD family secretion protein
MTPSQITAILGKEINFCDAGRNRMKPKSMVALLAIVVLGTMVSGCSFFSEEPEAEPVAAASTLPQSRVVSAEAFVVPLSEANLAFESGGRIIGLNVEEGDEVNQGDVLAALDDSTQQAALAEARANLAQAEAAVTESEAGLAESEANLANVTADPTEEEIAQLQAILTRSEAALAELLVGPTGEEIAQAEASVQTARAQLDEILADARNEDVQVAAARVMQAEADVRKAQTDYDRVRYGDPPDRLVVGGELEKATLNYDAAQAELDKLVNGATEEQIATGLSRVAEVQAALDKVLAGATPEQIAQGQADVAKAEADLAKLLAGATNEEIAIAEAAVARAKAVVESSKAVVDQAKAGTTSAQVQVDKARLTAPFAGTVSLVNVNEGEVVQSGLNVMSMGDTSGWQIETDDLTEIDVVDVQTGAKVTVSVDALPAENYEGKVVRITPRSETKAGDVTYTVLIDITKGDLSRLRWGMTTFVDIEVDTELAR